MLIVSYEVLCKIEPKSLKRPQKTLEKTRDTMIAPVEELLYLRDDAAG
ncbi:hypothetical protein [Aquimarina algiphila]|nr:hypothetical protein [Aquimarina algiphila]